MSAPNGTGTRRRTKKSFNKAEFNALHEAVGKLDFTPDFNPSIEYILMIEEVPLTEKLLALLKLQAWGNQRQLAVHDDARNKPFTQADAARKLNVSRQRIYEAAAKLVKRCQLRVEGQSLYPVADPAAEHRSRQSESIGSGSAADAQFFRLWLLEHPDLAEDYREAFRTIGSIKRQFKQEIVSGTGRENGAPASARSGQESGARPDTSGDTGRTAEPPILIEKKESNLEESSSSFSTEEEAAPEPSKPTTTPPAQSTSTPPETTSQEKEKPKKPSIVFEALHAYGNPDDDALNSLMKDCRSNAPDATEEEIVHFVHEKGLPIRSDRGNVKNPIGFLLTAVPKCFAGDLFRQYREQRSRERGQQAAQETSERQATERLRKEHEAALADLEDPNISEDEKRLIRKCLGLDDPGTAESEQNTKARKTGASA